MKTKRKKGFRLTVYGVPYGQKYFNRQQAIDAYYGLVYCVQGLGIEEEIA